MKGGIYDTPRNVLNKNNDDLVLYILNSLWLQAIQILTTGFTKKAVEETSNQDTQHFQDMHYRGLENEMLTVTSETINNSRSCRNDAIMKQKTHNNNK